MARSKQALLASAAGLLLVLLLAPSRPALAARPGLTRGGRQLNQLALPCATLGSPAGPEWMNAPMTCLELWSQPGQRAIATPPDSATWKYGVLQASAPAGTAVFVDSTGRSYPISASAKPPTNPLEVQNVWSLIIVQATIDAASGNVTSFQPWLYVPYSTVLASLANMQLEGTLSNTAPLASGVNATVHFRWTFGSKVSVTDPTIKSGTQLQGTFDNLFHAVRDQQGVCRPALCADPTRKSDSCAYYTQYFGESSNQVALSWDPNYLQVPNSMLVASFPHAGNGRAYITSFISLHQLLAPFTRQTSYSLSCFATPAGVPLTFTGTLSPAKPSVAC